MSDIRSSSSIFTSETERDVVTRRVMDLRESERTRHFLMRARARGPMTEDRRSVRDLGRRVVSEIRRYYYYYYYCYYGTRSD